LLLANRVAIRLFAGLHRVVQILFLPAHGFAALVRPPGSRIFQLAAALLQPEFAGQGIGTELLTLVERLMRERGIKAMQLEASLNAAQFYRRRGFEPTGSRSSDGAIPMSKELSSG